ncbi:MAG: pentapeptide repeat-containing protein [Candidatus Tectomicrobia bacterium]|uniref:Pentapeptide repeat-containing protein n=1 Tax=Tectimicrobiota bacterium TaxID=2528274 RepID=A0A937VWF2_UNCTE|nr:pentapeptide repeat-containing protein [Candidatus Tectomicrobia bacterium]
MILAQTLAPARAQRRPYLLPNGQEVWVAPVFSASRETPETPTASLVEQPPHTVIPSHFHAVNQFQVIIEGGGTLGKRAVHPWTVHYTNGYTGYGPLCAGEAGMAFFTLRNRCDIDGARFFPAGQSFMKPAPKRHHLTGPLETGSPRALRDVQHPTCESVLPHEDDGLGAWLMRLGPDMPLPGLATAPGGGQYLLVAGGTLVHGGMVLPRLSCLYVSADSSPLLLRSGADGLEVLLLQFPVMEAAQAQRETQPPKRSRGKPASALPEHVALVQQGAAAIAAWREAHPGARLHLAQADLTGLNLRGADLQGARLAEADLSGTDLSGADLQQADMRAAILVQANLTGARLQRASLVRANLTGARLPLAQLSQAHLHGACLYGASLQKAQVQRAYLVSTDLTGADLCAADIEGADLQWANLQGTNLTDVRLQAANLSESVLGATVFTRTQLQGTRGLETCRHQEPSLLDSETLTCSGPLPVAFLRGCGWEVGA